jgi:hypothetical protein
MGRSHALSADEQVAAIIERTVRERFEGMGVDQVKVYRETDLDGDFIITVKVVLDDDAKLSKFSRETLSGLIRHIRSNLSKVNEFAFPIVRMMSKKDAETICESR